MHLAAAQAEAVLIFLLPVFVIWVARASRTVALWEMALAIPFAVAVDLFVVFTLSRIFVVETAALVSRGAWLVALAIVARRRRAEPMAWPACLTGVRVAAALAAGCFSVVLGMPITRHFSVWDRPWHTPLVTSLAAQRIPFSNVYGGPLHYHLSGDTVAAMLRTFSFDVMSSNLCLALAHDLFFFLTATTVALLVSSFGAKKFWPIALAALALLLQGPIPLRGNVGTPFQGFAYYLFFSLSYRPHIPIAALTLVGFLGSVAVEVTAPSSRAKRTLPTLIATTSLLAVTDEASVALVCLGLGIVWLVYPRVLGVGRKPGVLVMIALAIAIVVPNLLFSGSLAPGGPVQRIGWIPEAAVPAASGTEQVLLSSENGKWVFFVEMLPLLACSLGLALHANARRSKPYGALALYGAVVVTVCGVLALKMRINGAGQELQRLFLAPFFVTALFGLLMLPRMTRGSTASIAVLLGTAVPAAYTVYWIHEVARGYMVDYIESSANVWARESTIAVDCRTVANARLGDRPHPTYVDQYLHYVYTSCRPIFGPGRVQYPWTIMTLPQFEAIPQLSDLSANMVGPNDDVDAICAANAEPHDPVCGWILSHERSRCSPEGTRFIRCPLSPAARHEILRR